MLNFNFSMRDKKPYPLCDFYFLLRKGFVFETIYLALSKYVRTFRLRKKPDHTFIYIVNPWESILQSDPLYFICFNQYLYRTVCTPLFNTLCSRTFTLLTYSTPYSTSPNQHRSLSSHCHRYYFYRLGKWCHNLPACQF